MRNSFNNFIVNDSNKEAYEYSVKVAKQETTEVNPLFISGPSGCGKSHLLDGIWHYYVLQENGKHPEWLSSFGMSGRFEHFTQGKKEFADKFNEIDLLLIDDIQLVDDKSNGELLPQVIDELVKRGKQICVTSSKSLDELNPKLKEVLSKGKCVSLSIPTKEEQIDFFKKVSKREGVEICGDDAYEYLCEYLKSTHVDYRNMLAILIRLRFCTVNYNMETAGLGKKLIEKFLDLEHPYDPDWIKDKD